MARRRRSAAGVAVNAGSEYQHRIGAFISSLMIARADLSVLLGSELRMGRPTSLSYETLAAVDDLNVATDEDYSIYIQAKRTLTRSTLRDVFGQFARQLKATTSPGRTILSCVTSSRSSHAISHSMRTVLGALRAAPTGAFSTSHNEGLQANYKFLVEAATTALSEAGLAHEVESVRDFLASVRIDVCDVERDEPMERMALLLLFARAADQATPLWDRLLTDNAWAASNRMTFKTWALEARFESALRTGAKDPRWFFQAEVNAKEIPVGVEYVLARVPAEHATPDAASEQRLAPGDIVFWGAPRFDGNCRKMLSFSGDRCTLPDGTNLPLLARAASAAALGRVMQLQGSTILERLRAGLGRVVVLENNVVPRVLDYSACAMRYRPVLLTAFHQNAHPSRCLVCGQPAVERDALTVEVDEAGSELRIGLVHAECWKPSQRVIGTVGGEFLESFPLLRRFDADAYLRALPEGHGAFRSLPARSEGTVFVMLWSGEQHDPEGSFCLRIELGDGSHVLAVHRGRVERLDRLTAERKAGWMNDEIRLQSEQGDPMCVKLVEDGFVHAPKSVIERSDEAPGRLLAATLVRAVRFDERAASAFE